MRLRHQIDTRSAYLRRAGEQTLESASWLFEIASVLVRFDHVAVDLHLPERWLSLLICRCEVVSKAIYFVRQLLF